MDPKRRRLDVPVEEMGKDGQIEDYDLSLFESLPEDVKYIIFGMAVDSLSEIRNTSKTMFKSVNEWATFQNLPHVDIALTAATRDLIKVELMFPRAVFDCFSCVRDILSDGVITRSYTPHMKSLKISSQIRFSASALYCVKKHLPIKYRKVKIVHRRTPAAIDHLGLQELLSSVTEIRELQMELWNLDAKYSTLIGTLTKLPIRRIKLKVEKVAFPHPHELLVDIASRVPEIEIRQMSDEAVALRSNYLFGLVGANWGSIATEMFEAGATRVLLANKHYSHLTLQDMDTVRLYLSYSQSKHVFCTTIDWFHHPELQELEAQRCMVPNYKFGRWKLFSAGSWNNSYRNIHYLRYRHEDLTATVVDDEQNLVPYTLHVPRYQDLQSHNDTLSF